MIEIAPLTPADYDEVMALWRATEGLTLRDADSREAIAGYLERNPALSFVARDGGVVGAVLGGHDGRRGYLYHLAVAPSHRGRGLGRALAERVMAGLATRGIAKCHILVHADNAAGRAFWARAGWAERTGLVLMSRSDGGAGA
jgi:ribosomal protein S18 acetylase RimI-like enzyme